MTLWLSAARSGSSMIHQGHLKTSDGSPVPSSKDNISERYVAKRFHCVDPQVSSEMISNRRYVMYHGTTRRNAASIQVEGFRPSLDGQLGPGVYLSRDHQKASRYPIGYPKGDKVVIQVLVDVGKVITIGYYNHPLRRTWYDSGYDSAWVPMWPLARTLEENCIRDPSRIRILQIIKHCELPKLQILLGD